MSKIITISREYGSGGKFIGELVAKKLGIPFYDREIMEKVAEETGFVHEYVEKLAEYAPSKSIFAYSFVGRNSAGESMEDYIYSVQRQIILNIAAEGPCVIVGRSADYILKNTHPCLNVFIHGDMPHKVARIMDIYDVSDAEAEKRIKEMDKKRSINYKYYTGNNWGGRENYDLSLNSSTLGIDKCVEIITGLV